MKNFILIFTALFIFTSVSCSKKLDENKSNQKLSPDTPVTTKKKDDTSPVNDLVCFGRWDGKKIIADDYSKYSANEKFMDSTGMGYELYGNDLKAIIGKYLKYDEQKYEYYFDDYKPEFEKYTSFKIGDKVFVSASSGVYETEVKGYYINLDDMIGAGTIFYAILYPPPAVKFDENEIVVCSFSSNTKPVNRKGITNKDVKSQFKAFILPKLKGIKKTEYDDKGKESVKQIKSLNDEEFKLYEGNFTGSGNNEFLVSVNLSNDFTNFTSLIFVMDGEGKILSEMTPLAANSFTFSQAEGITDINGDGIMEIITYDGYYEGGGYNLHKYNGGLFKTLTTGFVFGV